MSEIVFRGISHADIPSVFDGIEERPRLGFSNHADFEQHVLKMADEASGTQFVVILESQKIIAYAYLSPVEGQKCDAACYVHFLTSSAKNSLVMNKDLLGIKLILYFMDHNALQGIRFPFLTDNVAEQQWIKQLINTHDIDVSLEESKITLDGLTHQVTEYCFNEAAIRKVLDSQKARAAIEHLDLSPVLSKLCMGSDRGGYEWPQEDAIEVLHEYRQFLRDAFYGHDTLKKSKNDLIPSHAVDIVWHTHILFTQKYMTDCDAIFGYYLHHAPHV